MLLYTNRLKRCKAKNLMNIKDRIKSIEKSQYFKQANLHIHSSCSDGKLSFSELVKQGEKLDIKHMAISDHNTVAGWKDFDWQKYDFLIPAVEFDCFYKGTLLHILGYGIDPNNPEIEKICAKSEKETKYDIIRLFKSRHPKKAIDAIHLSGGIAVFAHPCCCWVLNRDKYTKELKDMGLDGIEVYYPYKRHRGFIKFHSRHNIKALADKYNLIITGGTDEHGSLIKQ